MRFLALALLQFVVPGSRDSGSNLARTDSLWFLALRGSLAPVACASSHLLALLAHTSFFLGIEDLLLVGLRFGLVFHYYSVSLLLVLLIIFSVIILPSSFPFVVLSFVFVCFLVQHLQTAMLAVPLLPATLLRLTLLRPLVF